MSIDENVIDCPAEEGARLVSLGWLGECDAAARRLVQGEDGEALHDFRVGLRRLRSTVRALEPWLSAAHPGKAARRLRRVARATNEARDAEVQLEFLAKERQRLGRRRPWGLDLLCARYRARLGGEGERQEVLERYARLSSRLARWLSAPRDRAASPEAAVPFGAVLATLLAEHLETLERQLGEVRGAGDEEQVHRARIAAKRLRYLLEPLRGHRQVDAQAAVTKLKALQDVLGDLHDCHILSREIAAALVECAAERARAQYAVISGSGRARAAGDSKNPRAGLLALAGRVRERRDALFAELKRDWLGGRLSDLEEEVKRLLAQLEARAGGRFERRRRYLLTDVPSRAEAVRPLVVSEGLVPGVKVCERVTRVRSPEGERFWRGLELGAGALGRKAEEETTREVFEALWPLTLGCRLEKERLKLEEVDLVVEVDRYLDRDLVLAEVAWPAEAMDTKLPGWLVPYVVREVTEEPSYANEAALAARWPPSKGADAPHPHAASGEEAVGEQGPRRPTPASTS